MASRKPKPPPAPPQQAQPAWYHPDPAALRAAGFQQQQQSQVWGWLQDGPTPADRWSIYLSLLPKTGEIFICHTRQPPNPSPRQYGQVAPLLTSVPTREEFSTLIKRYGWKHKPKTQPQSQQA